MPASRHPRLTCSICPKKRHWSRTSVVRGCPGLLQGPHPAASKGDMSHMEDRSVVIFGSAGRIGSAAAGILRQAGCRVVAVSWLNKSTGAARHWHEILAELASIDGDVDIVFASGLTDPSASASDLMLANVERPIGLI